MRASEIAQWLLAHGFRKTGANAYSASYMGLDYQVLLRPDEYRMQTLYGHGLKPRVGTKCGYEHIHVDEHGMLQGAGLTVAFVSGMRDGKPAPAWFTPEFTRHTLEETIPEWRAKMASWGPRPGP